MHGDKYDYSQINYINTRTKLAIICPKHGEFERYAHYHLAGNGCPECLRWQQRLEKNHVLKMRSMLDDRSERKPITAYLADLKIHS